MHDSAGDSPVVQLIGTLRFDELEGGFWTLELEAAIDGLSQRVELSGYEPTAGIVDGMRVRVRARHRPDAIGFRMAGPQVEVIDASPA